MREWHAMRGSTRKLALRAWLFATLCAAPVFATERAAPDAEVDVAPGTTPRSALERFLEDARANRFEAAADDALRAPGRVIADAALRAQQLKAVFDRFVWIEVGAISDHPEGRLDDGLAPAYEEIARIPTHNGSQPVRLVRLGNGRWMFSRETVAHIPDWYALLGNRWLRERLPTSLLHAGPFNLEWWQWIALPLLLLASIVVGTALAFVIRAPLRVLARRTPTTFDDRVIERVSAPGTAVLVCVAALVGAEYLDLPERADATATHAIGIALFVGVLWAAFRLVDLVGDASRGSVFVAQYPAMVGFLPLGKALAKIVVFVLAVSSLLQWFGLPVASVFASLGIGGVAIALAAKTTLENFLGAVTLGVDQPLLPGDLVSVDGVIGTVEQIGVRSTRIRTLDRTLVTLPNGRLADMKIESITARDRIRFASVLALNYETTAVQLRAIVDGIRAAVAAQPLVNGSDVAVYLKEIAASSFNVEVLASFRTTQWSEYAAIRQDLLLQMIECVERTGARWLPSAPGVAPVNVPASSARAMGASTG